MTELVRPRADVPKAQTWNRESVFESWDAFQEEYEAVASSIPNLAAFKGRLREGPDVIADWLQESSLLGRRVGRMNVFVRMAAAVDTHDVEAKAKMGQLMGLRSKLGAAMAFAEPEMMTLADQLQAWSDQEPRLRVYAHYFDNLRRQRAHLQTPETERLLGMVQDPFSGTYQTFNELTNTDMRFADALDDQGQPQAVRQEIVSPSGIQSADRVLRRHAWQNYCDQYRAMENTLATNLITSAKQHWFLAQVRGYDSVLESRLAPANLPVEVFYNLIETFTANLPVWHRYWAVKRKALGVKELRPYDIWAPIADEEPQLTYQQAVEWICDGPEPLGTEYVSILRRGALKERWE